MEKSFREKLNELLLGIDKGKLRMEDLKRVESGELWKDVFYEEKNVNGCAVVDVSLTTDLRILALCLGTYIRLRARREGLTERFQGNYHRDIIGMEGNLAVASYVYGNFLEALGYVELKGKSDSADLEIDNLKADVKTGTKSYHRMLMIDKKQWKDPERHFDVYIACTETDPFTIRVWGYATRQDVEQFINEIGWAYQGAACPIPLERLRPIKELKTHANGV